jgi:hypothetical protein
MLLGHRDLEETTISVRRTNQTAHRGAEDRGISNAWLWVLKKSVLGSGVWRLERHLA